MTWHLPSSPSNNLNQAPVPMTLKPAPSSMLSGRQFATAASWPPSTPLSHTLPLHLMTTKPPSPKSSVNVLLLGSIT